MAIPFKYNRRSLLVRRVSNGMTAGAIALVVAVFIAAMALVAGMDSAIRDTSSPDNLIVIGRGASSETASSLSLAQFDALKFLPAIRRDAQGNPLASPELAEQVFFPTRDHTLDNLPIRGLMPQVGAQVHDKFRIVEGRMLQPGLSEVVIGKLIVNRYPGCSPGSEIHFGRRNWKVVGNFEAGGSSFESEVWTDVHSLQEDSRRGSTYNSIRLSSRPARMLRHWCVGSPTIPG
jgi:putative ABC transport system permease protein